MKIALDLDDVVINIHNIWIKRLGDKLGRKIESKEITSHNLEKCLNTTIEVVLSVYDPDLYLIAPPVSGAIEGVQALNKLGDLVIVSMTDPLFETRKIEWLSRYFPAIKFDIRFSKRGEKKAKYLEDCDYFVDDYEGNFSEVKSHCILFNQPWNQNTNLGTRANGWPEVISCITNNDLTKS